MACRLWKGKRLQMDETRVYAGRIKDRDVLAHCSSGGAFTAISDLFLENDFALLCTTYNYDTNHAEFRLIFSKEERDKCRGSMYMQSIAQDTWQEALQWLKEHQEKKLVFFGVGCQSAAFYRLCQLKHVRSRVTFVDIICHGSPSPLIWKQYAEALSKNGRLSDINFRDKRTGWSRSVGIAKVDGKEVSLSKYRKVYSGKYSIRPCCSSCPYTEIQRYSDITIGDFWHMEKSMPDFMDEMGTSLFLLHTEQGRRIFDLLKEKMEWRESNITDCWQYNLEKPTQHSNRREAFWKDYKTKGIEYVMDKYSRTAKLSKIKKYLKILTRGGLFNS